MCQDHQPSSVSRRIVLRGAATGVAALTVLGAGAGHAFAQDVVPPPGAPLGDGSGDPEDRPGTRVSQRGATTTAEGGATDTYRSQNGWEVPSTNNSAAIGVVTSTVPGTGVRLSVRGGDVTTVLLHVAARFAQAVEPLGASCGGYAWRENVNSPGTWSNHASGTAIDLNWNQHPNGAVGTFSATQVEVIRTILAECRGVVRWGGDYTSTRDEMHFEINVPQGDSRLSQLAADLRGTPRRIAVTTTDRAGMVKEGGLYSFWTAQSGTLTGVVADGNRLAGLTSDGSAVVKDGAAGGGWVLVATGVAQVALGGGRIAVVGRDGSLRVKEGSIYADWASLRSNGVTRVALDGNRIAAIYRGSAQVKEGSVSASWVTVAATASEIALEARRLGVVEDGWVKVKQGPLTSQWVVLAEGDRIVLSGERIATLNSRNAFIKEGVYGSWILLAAGGVDDIALSGNRIAVIQGGTLQIKEGGIYERWVVLSDRVASVSLTG